MGCQMHALGGLLSAVDRCEEEDAPCASPRDFTHLGSWWALRQTSGVSEYREDVTRWAAVGQRQAGPWCRYSSTCVPGDGQPVKIPGFGGQSVSTKHS